jgi:hypothetical protein
VNGNPDYDTVRLLAGEVLLADPETLGNDALETDLYIPCAAGSGAGDRGSDVRAERASVASWSRAGLHPGQGHRESGLRDV